MRGILTTAVFLIVTLTIAWLTGAGPKICDPGEPGLVIGNSMLLQGCPRK